MASYRNPYNIAIANHQKRLDVANLKNDFAESLIQPLHGGGMSGGGMSGGDFWSDFADGFMMVWNPIIDVAGKVAPFLPLVGLGEDGEDYGMGMSGGDMSVNAPYIGYTYGSGMSGGEERSLVNQPYIGSGYSGGNIANGGIPPFNEITNAGMSGGRASDKPLWVVKQNDYCCVKNGKKAMPCNGKPLPKSFMNDYERKGARYRQGKLASQGAGMSGGDEITDTDHPVKLNPELQATMFLGGRKPSSVSKREKIGMVQQVIADMLRKKGKGMSGGDFWSDLGDTFSKVAPFLPLLGLGESGGGLSGGAMTYEQNMNMADAMGDIFSGMGQSGGGVSGGDFNIGDIASYLLGPSSPLLEGAGMSGGKRRMNKKVASAMLLQQLKNIHGRGLSGGDFDWSSLLSFAPLLLGLGMSGGQMNLDDLDELEPLVSGLGMSGGDFWDDLGKGFSDAWSWITDTAIPAITPVIDTAGKIADVAGKFSGNSGKKEGKGVSGGMYDKAKYGEIGLAGMGVSGGKRDLATTKNGDFYSDVDLTGMGQSGGSKASDTRMKSGAIQLYKGGKRGLNKQQRLALKIAHLQGKGMEKIEDMEEGEKFADAMARANPAVNKILGQVQKSTEKDPEPPHAKGLGVSGGKKTSKWITHVKAYAKQHGIKYGEALSKAKATYRG